MSAPARVVYFSDILCAWAYVAQRRMDELRQEFGDRVTLEHRLQSIFGFAQQKLSERWRDKGGLAAYSAHVRGVIAQFDHVDIHPDVWNRVVPLSSTPAHLVLAAVRVLAGSGRAPAGAFDDTAWRMRQAFFRDARDLSRHEEAIAVAREAKLDIEAIMRELASGAAHAELARDDHEARELDIHVSPTLVMGDGHQRLNGNVGYRVIAANLREILERPAGQHSWC